RSPHGHAPCGHWIEKDESAAVAATPVFGEIPETRDLPHEHIAELSRRNIEIDHAVAVAHERLDVCVTGVAHLLEPCSVDTADGLAEAEVDLTQRFGATRTSHDRDAEFP